MVSLINSLIGIVAGLITVITAYYLVLKYVYAPKFVIGVIPTVSQEKMGKQSSMDEFYFYGKYFAKKIKNYKNTDALKNDFLRRRIVHSRDNIKLPIIVQNIGRREAERYKIVISFSESDVRILNIDSETLSIDGLYAQNNTLKNKNLKEKNAPESIREYYAKIDLINDYVSLIGSIASKTFEMIILEVEVQHSKDFFINFRIDSPHILSKRVTFSQFIQISPKKP